MIIQNNRLIAEENKRLISDDIIAVEVWLAPSDSVNNWREISLEEAEAFEAELQKKREEEELREREAYTIDNEGIA